MEKLCILQNKNTKDVYLYINMQDLEAAGITPTYLSLHTNPAGESWPCQIRIFLLLHQHAGEVQPSKVESLLFQQYINMWDLELASITPATAC